jgi:large subunit ribosomal protein L23
MYTIIKKPVITEKSLGTTKSQRYTFIVDSRATKNAVKAAVKAVFGVDVVRITTVKSKSDTRRTGRRRLPRVVTPVKKAVIEVKSGQTIKQFETIG